MKHDAPEVSDELLARYNVTGPRYTSYPTAPEWSEAFDEQAFAETLSAASAIDEPLSLYVHIPFCWQMCSYCGCNVVISKSAEKADRYLDDLEQEIATTAAKLGDRRHVSQLHWGGGTPTFLNEVQIQRLFAIITEHFVLTPGAEVSIEVNPDVTRLEQLDLLRRLGFNRLSMGVQDFDPKVQAAINRPQSFELTRRHLEHARAIGFKSVNFDIIYGLPHQTEESWARNLAQVVGLSPDRVACYSFAYLPHLRPHQNKIPEAALPKGRSKLDLFLQSWRAFSAAGYHTIGMDHFAHPRDELATAEAAGRLWRNFQGYTVRAPGDTVAFGCTGISDIHGAYVQNVRTLPKYRDRVQAGRLATARGIRMTEDDIARRRLITQLMCNLRLDLTPAEVAKYAPELEALRPLADDGLIELSGGQLEVNPLGRVFLRNVAMVFDTYLRAPGAARRFSRTV